MKEIQDSFVKKNLETLRSLESNTRKTGLKLIIRIGDNH